MASNFQEASGKKLRIGIFGGTFDPVHNAHLEIGHRVQAILQLDQIIFIPNAQSPIKASAPRASGAQRKTMLALAIEGEPAFAIDMYEVERGGLSFSVETALHFKEQFPAAKLFWILGADQFEQLERWRDIEKLASLLTFAVFRRAGASVIAPAIAGLKYHDIEAPLMDMSSSEIRKLCAQGRVPSHLLPGGLDAFILQQGLYKQEG
ncbi:MAG: Nicotinate-nucleotide adenylyltransferase [Opitutia bacterium UBA7350]|nr:MAG: Nicotinate-nucleotide adenylyltransferase [Opitutae bacterium UBA7350]